ncbi:hypothetical protein CNMCM8980_003677 [Aspergillus fumigatiaffinis]|uniref:FAD-binding domain-containing protein n=1 Tax=Aspergillus fumigatiaffinis TaxID=340414 RepID=A0A8H4GHM5_9EURO|nr:hypothetical protein CNMCM5878_001980 [Aspergillus fumigatiaffinis]KAF4221881.1 hypothetical protein CNMCM6457_001577 [Aspergillus fumigatiaffinis]KAF4228458.1 hypothetical protein CNMCM6805_002158 [Aspergillus fumigatiaffinis]KAF4234869.1 hypothetical protein CNMCM8980_003677 [Aspergillus fumigatiaffinis]
MSQTLPTAETAAVPNSSGITVIIVGLGIAGLTTAVECHRRGHSVIGFEKREDHHQLGDLVGLGANGMNVLSRWDKSMRPALDAIRAVISSIDYYDSGGELKGSLPYASDDLLNVHVVQRSGLIDLLYGKARDRGIDLRFGVRVCDYWESEGNAGIVLENGHKVAADCVIAADGVHSKATGIFTGEDVAPYSTGAAIYRSHFDARAIRDDPEANWILNSTAQADNVNMYFGKDTTLLVGTVGKGKYVSWNMPHKQVKGLSNSWLQPADPQRVMEFVKDWPIGQKLTAILSKTPPQRCWNHSILARYPLSTWVSKGGRMIVIGDAAHPMHPNLAQGANLAIEDAAVVAICLELCGKENVPIGLRVMEKLRHKRVSVVQAAAIKAMERQFDANWDTDQVQGKPTYIPRPAWLLRHDCVGHTYDEYQSAALAVANGSEYIPTNAPLNGVYDDVPEPA